MARAGMLTKRGGSGILYNLIIGLVGAVIGGALFGALGMTATGLVGELVSATVGACLLLFLLEFIRKDKF